MNTMPTIPNSIPIFSFQEWRDRFLRIVLFGGCVFGLVGLVQTYFTATNPVYILIYASAYLFLLIVTLISRLPYWLRAGTFLLLLFTIGLGRLFETGVWGDSRLFFLALIVTGGLLFSPRLATTSIIASSLSIAVIGWFTVNGYYHPTSQGVSPGTIVDWVTGATALMVLGTIVVIGLQMFLVEFNKVQEQAGQKFSNLQNQQRNLGDRVARESDELERTANLLRASAVISQKLNEIKDVPSLLNSAVNLISEYFSHYHVGIFLSDDLRQQALLQAASSSKGRDLVTRGYRVEIGDASRVGTTMASGKPNLVTTETGATSPEAGETAFPGTRAELILPLTVRDAVIGALDVHSDKPRGIAQGDMEIFESLAAQIATSIENARLLSETQALNAQLESLAAFQTRSAWQGFSKRQLQSYQVSAGGVKAVQPGSRPATEEGLETSLKLRGQEIGKITLDRADKSGDWTGAELDLVEKVATQVALALDNNRLLEETRRRAMREQTVSEIAVRFSRILDVDTLLQTATREFGNVPDISEALVLLRGSPENNNSEARVQQSQIINNKGVPGYRFENDRLEPVSEIPAEILGILDGARPGETRIETEKGSGQQIAFVPILLRGQIIGMATARFKNQRASQETAALIEQTCERLAASLENARLVEETRQRSQRDALVSEMSTKFRATLDLDTVLKTAALEFQKAFQLKEAEVLLGIPTPTDAAGMKEEESKKNGQQPGSINP